MQTIDLEKFRSSALTGYVALDTAGNGAGAEVVSTKNGGHFNSMLDKWLNGTGRQKMSYNVLAALHRTLTPNGANADVVNAAFDRVFGADKMKRFRAIMGGERFRAFGLGRVTAEDIRNVLRKIDHANAQGAANVEDVKFAFAYGKSGVKDLKGVDFEGLTKEEVAAVKQYANRVGNAVYKADCLLSTDPALGGNLEDAKGQVNKALENLARASEDEDGVIAGIAERGGSVGAALSELLSDALNRKEALGAMLADYEKPDQLPDPVGEQSIKDYLTLWENVGKALIGKVIDSKVNEQIEKAKEDDRAGLESMRAVLKGPLEAALHPWVDAQLKTKADGTVDVKATLKNIRSDLKKEVKRVLADAGYALPKDINISDYIQNEINVRPWDPIVKTFTQQFCDGKCKDGEYAFESTITPASQVKTENGDGMPPVKSKVDGRTLNGVNCYCAKSEHEVNGAKDELRVRGPDGKEVLAFESWHHGVHSPYKEKDQALRTEKSKSRAEESVKGMFLSRADLVQKALEAHAHNPGGVVTVPFDVTSVSLLNSSGSELRMTRDQEQAWAHVNDHANHPIEIDINDGNGGTFTVRLKPTVNMFTLSANPLTKHSSGVGYGWSNVEGSNARAYAAFTGQVDAFLAANANSNDPDVQHRCKYVKILQAQLKTIWEAKSYQQEAGGAYKASSRIAVMTYLMGGIPDWNCKSGKDRTGMMSAECKRLAALVAMERDIPMPGDEPTADETRLFRSMVLKGGQIEVQRHNTGLGGYKVIERAQTIKRHLGGWIRRAMGLSKYTGAAK